MAVGCAEAKKKIWDKQFLIATPLTSQQGVGRGDIAELGIVRP